MTAFLERMCLPLTKGERNRMRDLLKRRGIDTSHWCHSPTRWYSDEALHAAVLVSTSYAGVLRVLGIPQAGGSQACIARRIRAAGIDTSHFRGQAHNRGKSMPRLTPAGVLVTRPAGSGRIHAHVLRRADRCG
jgi:hypothetical protein